MNTKTTKFLTVLAVFAMAFAGFAVVSSGDSSDATVSYTKELGGFEISNTSVTGEKVTLTLKGQTTLNAVTGTGLTTISGYTLNTKDSGTAYGNAKFSGSSVLKLWFPAMATGYDSVYGISIQQTSTAIAALTSSDMSSHQVLNGSTMTSWFAKSTFNSANDFEFLIPQDGTGVALIVTIYGSDFSLANKTGTAIGSAQYTVNLAGVTTVVDLSAGAATQSLKGDASGGWAYTASSDNVLTLNNFVGQVAFLGVIKTVSLVGTNSLYVNLYDSSSSSTLKIVTAQSENAAISSNQQMTIKTSVTATKAYLTVTNIGTGFGISTDNSLTIGDTTGETGALNTVVTAFGGDRGIYAQKAMTIDNAKVSAAGSERAIHVYADKQTLTISGGSEVTATLDGNYLNYAGDDDVFGVKIGRGSESTYGALTLSEGSTLTTQGLRVTGTITLTADSGTDLADKIYISSGYIQNPIAKITMKIAGFYLDQMTGTLTVKKQAEPKDADTQGVYFIGDVDYYAPKMTSVTVTDAEGGQSSYQANATDAAGVEGAIAAAKTAGVKEVIVNVTGAVTGLNAAVDEGKEIELRTTGDGAVTGNIQLGSAANTVGLSSFEGIATFTNGSIVMNIVEWTGGDVVLTNGDVLKITGTSATVSGNVKITGPDGENESATVLIDDGQTLTINSLSKLSITGKVKMNNDGALIGGGYIDVAKPSTFYSSKPVSVYFSGDGTILIDDATETVYLSGKYISQNTYAPTQKVIVNENLTIEKNAFIIIKGGLVVPAGVTITIQDGGYLMLDDTTAYADIDGDIKSSSALGFVVTDDVDGDVEISGNIIASKASTDDVATVSILGEATLSGTLTVNAKAEAVFGKLTITEDGAMIVNGAIFGEFYNEGSVTINGSVDVGAIIHTAAADAVVKIDALKAGDLTITDAGMYLRTVDGVRETVSAANANIMTFSNVMGVTVTEDIVFYMWDDVQYVYNATYLDGVLTVADKKSGEQPSVTISNGSNNYVIGELTVTQAFVYIEDGAKLSVIGKAYIENTEYVGFVTGLEVEIGGALEVSGLLRSATEEIDDENYITAVKYSVMDGATQYYYYTNLADAIASGAKDLTVLGTLKISKDTTIPAGFDVDASGKTVNVGSAINTEVTLTVAKGGSLSAKTINVYGTLYVEDVDTGIACNNIISDVSNVSDDDAVYTNIYYALSTATLGDVVKITNKDGKVVLKRDATVPFGVTLLVPANEILGIQVGQTLTVAGELEVKGAVNAYNKDGTDGAFGEKANATHAAIAVTGLIESLTNMPNDTYHIPGAYYTYKTLYCITSLANSALIINDAEGQLINVYGDKMAYGNVTYEGTATKPVTVNIRDSVASGTITISYGTINLATKNYDMTIAGDNGNVKLAGVNVTTAAAVLASEKDGYETIAITKGVFAANGASTLTTKGMTFDGDFIVSGSTIYNPSAKGDLVLSGNVTLSGDTTVSGSMTVDYAAVVVAAKTTVKGTLVVLDATSTKAAGKMTVSSDLLIGGTSKDYTTVGSSAIVAGDVTVTGAKSTYVIFAGSVVEGKVAEDIVIIKEEKHYTDFYVEDELFISVYAKGDTDMATYVAASATVPEHTKYSYVPKALENCDFVAWQYISSGELYTITTDNEHQHRYIGYKTEVYALIDYNIYDVTVVTDAGIKAVSIDGIQMVSNGINQFTSLSPLIAGTHTITYTLKDGYEESTNGVILYTEDGIILKDHKFIADGTETEDRDITLQLSGTQKEVAPEPEPTPEPEKESEWNVTTILLLVLVILIAIMAVIVALRLNRN